MNLRPFIPAVTEIPAAEAEFVRGLPEAVRYWAEDERPAGEWFREVEERWGTPGLVMRRGSETLGYVLYAPVEYLPRAFESPAGPVSPDAVLIACASGDPRARRHLLVRTLREMRLRGVSGVESIGSDSGIVPHHLATRHLLECGWQPVRRGRRMGLAYTLTRVDLGSAVEVGDLARGLIGRVRLPAFGRPAPSPGTSWTNRSGLNGSPLHMEPAHGEPERRTSQPSSPL